MKSTVTLTHQGFVLECGSDRSIVDNNMNQYICDRCSCPFHPTEWPFRVPLFPGAHQIFLHEDCA